MTALIHISGKIYKFFFTSTVNKNKTTIFQILSSHSTRNFQNTTMSHIGDQEKGVLDKKVIDTIVINRLHPKTNVLTGYRNSIA